MNMEDFYSDGSDIDIEFKGFESDSEDENDFVPVDPPVGHRSGNFWTPKERRRMTFGDSRWTGEPDLYRSAVGHVIDRNESVRGTGTSSDPHDLKVDPGLENRNENIPRAVSLLWNFKATSTPRLLEAD
ncbi:unnamed protein product [Boreogadus saida]